MTHQESTSGTSTPWYEAAFQKEYLDLYLHRDLAEAARAVRFLKKTLELRPDHHLLDLCCGPGRHLPFLGRMVGRAVGLDLSRVLLERAREHWHELNADTAGEDNQDLPPEALLVNADMRHMPLASGSFDRVVNLFTSFGYFGEEAQNEAVLKEISRVLRKRENAANGGMTAIDHINRSHLLENFESETRRDVAGGRQVIETRSWDEAASRIRKSIVYQRNDGEVKQWRESVRVYYPDELETMLRTAGLEPLARYGDYEGSPWRETSPRLILIASRE